MKTNHNISVHFLTFMAWKFPKHLEIMKYLRTFSNINGLEVSKTPGNYEISAYIF